MRALFFGTPDIAVEALRALTEVADVVGVVCQPDRPSGRGMKLKPPAVKVAALELGLDVVQPERARGKVFRSWVSEQSADVAVVMAYGHILPRRLLGVPRLGFVNLHASLLPKYRGAAPIQWAIANGESKTGVTLMQMDAGMDTGDVLSRWTVEIDDADTSESLATKLSSLAYRVVISDIPKLARGELVPEPQDDAEATYARMLTKRDGAVNWTRPARQVFDWIRAMNPWPGAFSTWRDQRVKIHGAKLLDESSTIAAPGTVVSADKNGIVVACERGTVSLQRLQLPGKRALDVAQFVVGRSPKAGDEFEVGKPPASG